MNDKSERRRRRLTVPRAEIAWYPVIDADLCNSCLSCYNYCPKDVFASAKAEEGLR
ncbi:MAG TPA: ferredoxin family protein, partial [Chlorobaculum parvum]|nr:ferredoxin family protein [Chlorobaculum parvum]